MSIELQAPAENLHLQEDEKNDDKVKDMEQEIECPRCADMMTLSSDFDRLGYVCQECDLLLIMNS
jgi:polyhydroxyalkanoate synthesis regulator phasin